MSLNGQVIAATTECAQWFATTHWTVILKARDGQSPGSAEALEILCRNYWRPLYAFARRRGHAPHDAQDLIQEFFARLVAKNYLSAVEPAKGKFRTFLLAALQHFLAKEWRRSQAQKRGGGVEFLSLDAASAEGEYLQIAGPDLPPEKLFEQQWALALLAQVTSRLRSEFIGNGKGALFDELKIFLTGEKRAGAYAELAPRLRTTEAALRVMVSRMRQRYGELLCEEISRTVSRPEEVQEELRALFIALG